MKKQIFILISILILNIVTGQNYNLYYKISAEFEGEGISISQVEIEFSQKTIENSLGTYSAEVLNYEGKILDLSFFDISKEVQWDGVDPETGEMNNGGVIALESGSFELFIPYYESAKEIVFYDENLTEITKKDVREYSKVYKIEEVNQKGEADIETEGYFKEESFTENLVRYWWVLLIILVGLIGYLIYSLKKKKSSQ